MRRAFMLAVLVAGFCVIGPSTPRGESRTSRAMWLWDPSPQLLDASARASFFQALERESVGTVWAQVGSEPTPDTPPGAEPRTNIRPSPRRLTHADEWRELLAAAHARGIRIEALDGDPTWALKAYHQSPLGVVEAVLDFNRAAGPRQQFDGIHLDIEPYLLMPWRFRLAREQLLREYLDLLVLCQTRTYELPGMQFGVDIPFWWGTIDDRTGRPIGDVLFQGTRKAASDHLLDRLDNVGIMNYRNVADGGDGLIAHGKDLLAYADRAKRARVWMGVETSRSAPTPVWFAVGLPSAEADRRLQEPGLEIGRDSRLDGFSVRLFDDGLNTHVGLAVPDSEAGQPSRVFVAALVKLAQRFGVLSKNGPADRAEVTRGQALRGFAADREWERPAPRSIVDPVSGRAYPGVVATSVMLSKLTFAGLPQDLMRKELAIAEHSFAAYSSYAGVAIHHYTSYMALTGAPSVAMRMFAPTSAAYRTLGTR
jgi:hypothetical protein